MKAFVCLAAVAALITHAESAAAQDVPADRPTIIVTGSGRAERAPDTFAVSANLEGRGADRVSALRRLSEVQLLVGDGLGRLEGLTGSELTTGEVSVRPIRSQACGEDQYDRDELDCPVTGYLASIAITLKGSPVERAGDAVSLASELGAENASFSGGSLSDQAGLADEANRAAFVDARYQAEALAQASGQRIVRTLRVQEGDYSPPRLQVREVDDIVVTGSRRRPAVGLSVSPEPVRIDARLTVIFEVE